MILKPDDFEIGMYITVLENLPHIREGEAMNHLEKYCDRELIEIRETCKGLICEDKYCTYRNNRDYLVDICEIALIQINSELDVRAIRKEGRA